MFSRSDFWIGLAVGALAGIVGYKFMSEQSLQCNSMLQAPIAQGNAQEIPVDELMRQKERLEDLIAERQTATA
jgi:hypothetical protein